MGKSSTMGKRMSRLLLLFLAVLLLAPAMADAADRGIAIRQKLAAQSGVSVGAYRALIIGINDYQDDNIPDLETAAGDARAVADLLRTSYGFKDITLLLNRQASASTIQRQLRRLATGSKKADSVLIYYAGHGDLDRITHDGWWIPANARAQDPSTYLDNFIIQKYVKAIPARHVLLVADSCFSGSLFGSARAMPSIIDDKYYGNLYKEKSRWGMTSGNLTPVSDSGSGGHSAFAYQFIKALQQNHKPYVTPREIYQRIAPIISNNSDQMPITKPIRNADDQGGEFIFIRSDGGSSQATSGSGPAATSGPNRTALDMAYWNDVKGSNDANMLQLYLNKYPNGQFADIARLKIKKLGGAKLAMAGRPQKASAPQYALTIRVKPLDARIRILNIKPRYRAGIRLDPGDYHISVSRSGYVTRNEWIRLGRSDLTHEIALEKRTVSAAPAGSTSTVAGIEMVAIPSGSFSMGSNNGADDEKPVHSVHINSFKMSKYEITQSQWESVMGSNPSAYKGANRPVEQVSWDDIQIFLRKLNQKTGQHFRLPTEAEWEYAARAGTTTKYSWGDTASCDKASYDGGKGSSCYYMIGDDYRGTKPVGSFQPNSFGLYDMHGNVWEWVQDCYHVNYNDAPSNGSAWESGDCAKRVLRGGSWDDSPVGMRSANRFGYTTVDRGDLIGFRLVQD